MKEKLVFKGKPEKVVKEIQETSRTYTLLCHLKGIEPTIENILKLKKMGW